MKVVILAGGLGTRLAEETSVRPKPMVEIGDMPILWHIMKIYSSHGFNDFVICLGYKGYVIKKFFIEYFFQRADITVDLKNNSLQVHDSQVEPWKVTLVDTGDESMTGGRIKRIQKHIGDSPFMLTYGDGVADIDVKALLSVHEKSGKKCTVTSVQPSGRFGLLVLDEQNGVASFSEKPKGDGAWINGGFFVCEPSVFKYINDDSTIWEKEPLQMLASEGQLQAYKHGGFWRPMDTLKDKMDLNIMWNEQNAPWKIW